MTYNLKDFAQWVTWKAIDGKKSFATSDGKAAKSNDPSTWSSFDAIESLGNHCFVFSAEDPFFGIDLDDCIHDGKLSATAQKLVDMFDGKASIEVSQSGTGLHITGAGRKPSERSLYTIDSQRVEVYDSKRFWIVTWQPLDPSSENSIHDCQNELDAAIAWMESFDSKKQPQKKDPLKPALISSSTDLENRARAYLAKVPVPMRGERNNGIFKACGHLHSLRDEIGGKLSVDQVATLAQEWYGTSDPEVDFDYIHQRARTSEVCGTPRAPKVIETGYRPLEPFEFIEIDLSAEIDPAEFVESLVPDRGLIKEVYDFYQDQAISPSSIIGMATAVSFAEMLFGQRIQSQTALRTNDLNVILGPTGCGKEACEKTITRIMDAVDNPGMVMPAGVQSGNGLLGYMADNPVCIWVKDEFGVYLENVFGKRKQPMEAQVGRLLLELYNKAETRYSGNAHASGCKNAIDQPHLVLLGLSTQGTIFDSLSFKDVENGLINRIAFWVVTERPALKEFPKMARVPELLRARVKGWLEVKPMGRIDGSLNERPYPYVINMTEEAFARWNRHRMAIHERSSAEDDGRSSLWTRTAARTMKYALVHWASGYDQGKLNEFQQSIEAARIEIESVEWAIRLSNFLTRSACTLIENNTVNTHKGRGEVAILDFVSKAPGWVNLRTIMNRKHISKGDLVSAAVRLESEGKIKLEQKPYGKGGKEQIRVSKIDS